MTEDSNIIFSAVRAILDFSAWSVRTCQSEKLQLLNDIALVC